MRSWPGHAGLSRAGGAPGRLPAAHRRRAAAERHALALRQHAPAARLPRRLHASAAGLSAAGGDHPQHNHIIY